MSNNRQDEREAEQMDANLKIMQWETDDAATDNFPERQPDLQLPESADAKRAKYQEASPDGTLSADYRATTEHVYEMVPEGGTVVDLGEGRYAEFIAKSREDVNVILVESDPVMYELALQTIKEEGLEDRITVMNKSIPEALEEIKQSGTEVHAITSLYRTHLQDEQQNEQDFKAIGELAESTGASVFTLDLHRATQTETAELMPDVFPADGATQEFRDVYESALKHGAYRGDELEGLLQKNIGGEWDDRVAHAAGQLQIHKMEGRNMPDDAPKPVYPETHEEYIKVAGDMNMIMWVGDDAEMIGDTLRFLSESKDTIVSMGNTAIENISQELEGVSQGFDSLKSKFGFANDREDLEQKQEPEKPTSPSTQDNSYDFGQSF